MKKNLVAFVLLALLGCKKQDNTNSADAIYFGGDILTMEGETANYVEAVAVKQGKIIFVGTMSEAEKFHGNNTSMNDLEGKTMMPGFVEPHVHPSIAATMLPNEIISMNDWVLPNETKIGVIGHDAYIKRITESINTNAKPDESYLIWGYHQLWHGEMSRAILNKIAPNQPVGILHRSFHEIYVNDAFIKKFNIKEEDYKGNPQVEWKEGHFYEGGWLALVPKLGAVLFNPVRTDKGMEMMSQLIHKNGITTICEPGFGTSDFNMELAMLKKEMDKTQPYEVYLIPNGTQLYASQGSNEKALEYTKTLMKFDTDNIHFLPNQIKLFADGAIYSQAMQMIDGYTDGHKGEWMTPLDLLRRQMTLYWNANYKIHIHANGDQGIQQVLDFNASDQKVKPRKEHRLTLHHMGYFSKKQAKQIADLGIEASVNPYYLWALADKYSEVGLGKDRAQELVRIKSLLMRIKS